MNALFSVSVKLFKVAQPLDLHVAAHDWKAAANKVRRLLENGKLFVTNTFVIIHQDGRNEPVSVRSRIHGLIEAGEVEKVWDRAFHKARWVENTGKFVLTPPKPYYHGRRLANESAAQGTAFVSDRLTQYIESKRAEQNAASEAVVHAREDFSPRCKGHAAKLAKRIKGMAKSDAYAVLYAQEWARLANEPKPTKKTTTRKKVAAVA